MKILGTDYEYLETTEKADPDLVDLSGYSDNEAKKIVVSSEIESGYMKRKIMRHEIIHAFLHESGLDHYNSDDIIVDWIANQFPKLQNVFQQMGAI